MIHLYTTRHYRHDTYKILCTRENLSIPIQEVRNRITTVPDVVTCTACLDILIPKFEAKLQKMHINRMVAAKESGEAIVSPTVEVPINSGDITL